MNQPIQTRPALLRAHENSHTRPNLRAARETYLEQREARRQEAVAAAVVSWDAGAA